MESGIAMGKQFSRLLSWESCENTACFWMYAPFIWDILKPTSFLFCPYRNLHRGGWEGASALDLLHVAEGQQVQADLQKPCPLHLYKKEGISSLTKTRISKRASNALSLALTCKTNRTAYGMECPSWARPLPVFTKDNVLQTMQEWVVDINKHTVINISCKA